MERRISTDLLRFALSEALTAPTRELRPRDGCISGAPGQLTVVTGVRGGGKTSFLERRRAERLADGAPRESQLLLELEDERLTGMTAADLAWLLDEHARRAPRLRECGGVTLYLDEVHRVEGWETLVRRLLDRRDVEVWISGSSAKLLGREGAAAFGGRIRELLLHPFSFREVLRHAGQAPKEPWECLGPAHHAALDAALRRYLEVGGFPAVRGLERRDRLALSRASVDAVMLRDVIERHGISNPTALFWLQRHLLATPGGGFSMKKLYDSLRAQGVAVSKDSLYEYLEHLQDALLLRTVSMHSASDRQRMTNPRKAYPIDPSLIPLYERTGRKDCGPALEAVILLELERRGYTADWLRTGDGGEVTFFAHHPCARPLLVQVTLDTEVDPTWLRDVRSLAAAAEAYPDATALLLTLDTSPPTRELPPPLRWMSAARWLLEGE